MMLANMLRGLGRLAGLPLGAEAALEDLEVDAAPETWSSFGSAALTLAVDRVAKAGLPPGMVLTGWTGGVATSAGFDPTTSLVLEPVS